MEVPCHFRAKTCRLVSQPSPGSVSARRQMAGIPSCLACSSSSKSIPVSLRMAAPRAPVHTMSPNMFASAMMSATFFAAMCGNVQSVSRRSACVECCNGQVKGGDHSHAACDAPRVAQRARQEHQASRSRERRKQHCRVISRWLVGTRDGVPGSCQRCSWLWFRTKRPRHKR